VTYALSVLLVVVGLGYLVMTLGLSRTRKPVPATGDEPEMFVFVVPALNEELVIGSTVDNLLASCDERGRILVVDDGSTDGTAAIVRARLSEKVWMHQRTLPDARVGKGAALNDVYRHIRAKVLAEGLDPARVVLCIVDADGRLEPGALRHVAPYFRSPRVGAVQLLVRIRNRDRWLCRFQDYEFLVFSSLTQTAREKLGSVGLGGNGQFTRLAALMELGDNPWTDCLTEDLDLGVRLAVNGWENRFCGETFVDQQGLTSLRLLLRQRTRWAHGHFQCWKLIPRIVASQLPTVTALDLCYYLLAPAMVLVGSMVFTTSFAWFGWSFATNLSGWLSLYGLAFALMGYVLSFGPALYLAVVYWRRSGDVSLPSALLLAHLLAIYYYVWYVAEWKAIVRIISRKNGWAKTARSAESAQTQAPAPAAPPTLSGTAAAALSPRPEPRARRSVPTKRVLVVFGTRPEAIKMVPVIEALRRHPHLTPVVAVTGQHREMLHQVLEMFGVVPDVDLHLHAPGQTLEQITARALDGLAPVLREVDPGAVVVQGDTTTTFAAALSAFYAKCPVVHVEAGLRTGDLRNPFPEEANRRLTTRLTALHLAATPGNRDCLLAEGVDTADISVTGNTVIDALRIATGWESPWADPVLTAALGQERRRGDRPTVLVTAHRRESWGDPLREVAAAIGTVAAARRDVQFVWPLHANPAVRSWVAPAVEGLPNVVLTRPAGYADFVRLMTIADVAVTDSGGVQEEAPALGLPVLVTRNVTERQEAVACGAALLVGTDRQVISRNLRSLLADPAFHASMTVQESPYGDGFAGTRSAAAIGSLLGVDERLPDFIPPPARSLLTAAR